MPFQSEKQRRYLWANEPEIARDWSDKYGSRVKKLNGGITRIPFANGSPYKDALFNYYQDTANQENLTYGDSPIFQQGLERYDPSSLGSKVLQNVSIPFMNWVGSFQNDPSITRGAAGIAGTTTSAGFKQDLLDKIKSGTATDAEKLEYSRTFGHEMTHLGWDYKPANERVSIGDSLENLKYEGGKFSGLMKGASKEYGGEEQWNRMHDLMYGAPEDWKTNLADLKGTYQNLPAGSPERKEAWSKALAEHLANPEKYGQGEAENYLTERGLINPGDLSYTPKGHEAIAWSGLTSGSKKAIGFGVNPHEDTMMGRTMTYPNVPFGEDTSDAYLSGKALSGKALSGQGIAGIDLEAENIANEQFAADPTFETSEEEEEYNEYLRSIGQMPTIKDPNMFQRMVTGARDFLGKPGLSSAQQSYINKYGRDSTGRIQSGPFQGQNLFGASKSIPAIPCPDRAFPDRAFPDR